MKVERKQKNDDRRKNQSVEFASYRNFHVAREYMGLF